MSHTPGPWMIDRDYRAGMSWNTHIVLERNPDHRICFMTSDGKKDDAWLIAAAPDMLAALRRLTSEANFRTDGHKQQCGCCVCEGRAAIAKATEPQP